MDQIASLPEDDDVAKRKRKRRVGQSSVTDPNRPIPYRDFAKQQGWSASTRRRRKAQGIPIIAGRDGLPDMIKPAVGDAWLCGVRRRGRPAGSGKGAK